MSEQLAAIAYGPVKPYLRDEALEEVFKRVRSPRVLHVSTHGFFLEGETEAPQERQAPLELENAAVVGRELLRRASGENPLLRSGLVLAGANELKDLAEASTPEKGAGEQSKVDDGWLTAEEVALMDLRGTELVVLSACETGQGDVRNGEGVYGLRRAFQLAGAQTIVMTLFKVPDAQSAQIMKGFYEGLKAQEGKLKALHEAQLEVIRKRREEGGAAHPFFWAGFVLAGDPN